MIHWHWKAGLISTLSVEIPSIPFSSAGEIIKSRYQITLVKDSSYQAMFEESESEPLKTIWRTKFQDKEKSLLTTPEDMIPLVMTGDYAMYETFAAFQTLQASKDCLITDVGFHMVKMDFAFSFSRGSPYRDLINYRLRKMIETGTLQRLSNI